MEITLPRERALKVKVFLMTLLAVAALLTLAAVASWQPIHTDEIVYFMLANRYVIESGMLWWHFPQCIGDAVVEAPTVWIPVLLFRSFIFDWINTPAELRLSCFLLAAVFLVSLATYAARKDDPKWALRISASVLAFFIGTIPAYLASGRPEAALLCSRYKLH